MHNLTEKNFKEDSPADENSQNPSSFTINTSKFHTKRFQSPKKSSSFHDKSLPFFIHFPTFSSDYLIKNKEIFLSLFPQILKDFFNKQSLFGENLKKLGIFWIENLMGKKLELKQNWEGICENWDRNKQNFLRKMVLGKDMVISEEFKGILQIFEGILSEEVRNSEIIN